jgi:two-component system heavy metal sensor histidine kinase CusS
VGDGGGGGGPHRRPAVGPRFQLHKYQTEAFQRRPPDDGEYAGLYNIHLPRTADGRLPPIRPASMGFNFPLDPDQLDHASDTPEDHHDTDDVVVPGHGVYHRVVYRYPLFGRLSTLFGQPPRRDPKAPASQPSLYIQYARPRADLDALLSVHHEQLAADLAEIRGESARYRRQFLTLLVLVGVAGFLSLFAGSLWIIRRGLRPLATLSTAVSRVSERDFRLPVAADQLSEDLLPIHRHLTLTLDALRRAFEREKQAVGDISHELRTPLAALRTTLDVALRKPREAEQYKVTLTDCREIARQLSRLVDRILTLASLDSGSIAPSSVPTDISALAIECVAVIRPMAESHGLTFRTEIAPGVAASTDPDRLREVMMNLLHNAVEYNSPGGDITLCVAKAKSAVRVAVRDTGIGIPAELRTKIFERFYRADASRHATGVHAGLGLAIVKEYLTRLGGTIAVESEPGRGTTFTVTLPA